MPSGNAVVPRENTLLVQPNSAESKCPAKRIYVISGCLLAILAIFVVVFTQGLFVRNQQTLVTSTSKAHFRKPDINGTSLPFASAHNAVPPSNILSKLHPPLPTHAFWGNWYVLEGVGPAVLIPYAMKCLDTGIMVSYPAARRTVTVHTVSDYFQNDIAFTAAEKYQTRYVTDYDYFTVKMHYEVSSGGSYGTTAVRGCPYVTIEYSDATPVMLSDWSNTTTINGVSWGSDTESSVTGTKFLLDQADGMRWLIFTSSPITWIVDSKGRTLTASQAFTGTIRAARSYNETTDEILSTYAATYPTGGDFSYEVEGDTVTYQYRWTKNGDGQLLMGTVKHLSDIMDWNSAKLVLEGAYDSLKGPVDLVAGDSWVLEEWLPTTTWYAPRTITNEDKLEEMIAQLKVDVLANPPGAGDPYGVGKQFGRMARIVLIAEEYNVTDVLETGVSILKEYMDKWLTTANEDYLVYETNYGGVVSKNGLSSWAADFGNGWYNDHHFHYGYFCYALAVLIKIDPSYYTSHQGAIDFILSDVGNMDPNSELFPVARHKDFYDHHSWALGLFATWDGKSQESSSEAVNAYYGMWLLAIALNDQAKMDWTRTLLAMELRGTHYYWQIHSGNEAVYDYYFSANKMVGQVGGLDAFCQTWFGDQLEYIHGIQMLPFTPITEELLPYDYILTEWPVVKTALDDPNIQEAWVGILYLDFAIVDPTAAWDLFAPMPLEAIDSGLSKANAMYWILTREDHGPYTPAEKNPQVVVPSCDINTGCRNAGYTSGSCCPTVEGEYMDCCPKVNIV